MTDSSSIVHKFPQVLKKIRGGNLSDLRGCFDSFERARGKSGG
jgi:hypothetical protein